MDIIPFDRKYGRAKFSCGKPALDHYIILNVTKDVKAGACTCFVDLDTHAQVIAYYTLTTDSVPLDGAPDELKHQITYPYIPVVLLGRLAVHTAAGGQGYGKLLLVDALKRSLTVARNQVGAKVVIVDPIDTDAERFYGRYGFTKIPDSGRMFMTMRKIEAAFNTGE